MAEYNLHQTSTRVNKPQLQTSTITEACRGGDRKYCPKDSPTSVALLIFRKSSATCSYLFMQFLFQRTPAGSEIDKINYRYAVPCNIMYMRNR
ncbi:hypothetical protein DPMN_098740 [Dreissena polymorpha]|uniref:Uncharacterized protein n=1 Tax=Dreissena polymorpha TaxID=45954 RepID=A0A9D4LE81_DREPO|nr:hypothetical protein DPMN_098740 [Dreissena polymorpha]